MIPIVILASGRGSNFDAIQTAIRLGLAAEVCAVISDRPSAPVLVKAKEQGIEAICIPSSRGEGAAQDHEGKLLQQIQKLAPKFLVFAGYRKIVSSRLIEAFRCDKGYSRMINIHPSLLPSFPGLNSYAQAFRHGVQVTGVTVHLVESEVDSGPICAQEAFSIRDCRSEKEVEERGLKVEHRLFPETLAWVLPEKFTVERRPEGRLCVCQN